MIGRLPAGQSHEDDVLATCFFDLPRMDDAPGIGEQDHLQQDPRIVGESTGIVVVEFEVQFRQVHVMINEVVNGEFESAGDQLMF